MIQLLLNFVTLTCRVQVINKVAGVYGLVAVFTGGSLAQLSMYIYSVALLFVYVWGIRVTSMVSPQIFSTRKCRACISRFTRITVHEIMYPKGATQGFWINSDRERKMLRVLETGSFLKIISFHSFKS